LRKEEFDIAWASLRKRIKAKLTEEFLKTERLSVPFPPWTVDILFDTADMCSLL